MSEFPLDDDLDENEGNDEEDDGLFHDEIVGVDAPTIDLEQVGISRSLAIVLGPEGTRNLVEGALLRGIGRVLHPDVSTINGATEAYSTINATVTAIGRLTPKQWQEVYRRFVIRRDDIMSRLTTAQESMGALRASLADREEAIKTLEARLETNLARAADTVSLNAAISLFYTGTVRPSHELERDGDSSVHVSELLHCIVLSNFDAHFVRRPGRVVSASYLPNAASMREVEKAIIRSREDGDDLDRGVINEVEYQVIRREAARYQQKSGNRGIFAATLSALPPRVIAGCYTGKLVSENSPTVFTFEDCPAVLKDCQPYIEPRGTLLIAALAISGKGRPTGIEFTNYGPVCSIYGPYNTTRARVTGPHIGDKK